MSAFWDVFQDYGKRTNYANAFRSGSTAGGGWNDETFTPKYRPITAVDNQSCMFENTQITEVSEDKVDFSQAVTLTHLFRYSTGIKTVVMNVSSALYMTNAFRQAPNLTSVTLKYLREDCSLDMAFYGCTGLTDLKIYRGTIGTNFGVSNCTKLTVDSLFLEIILNLANKANSGTTATCTLGATNLAKLTDEQKAVATQKGWTLA